MLPSDLPDVGIIGLDTECSGLFPDDGARVSTVSVAWFEGEAVKSAAFPFGQGPDGQLFASVETLGQDEWEALCDWIAGRRWVAHNAKYDARMIAAGTRSGYPGRDLIDSCYACTFISAWVLEPLEQHSLAAQAERHLGRQKVDHPAPPAKLALVPFPEIEQYARVDAELALLLARAQSAMIRDHDSPIMGRLVRREQAVMRMLTKMEARGVGYDYAQSLLAATECNRMADAIDMPFIPTPEGARRYFFGEKNAKPHCVSPGGKASVGECCVRYLAKQGIPGAAEYARKMKLQNAVSKWYLAYAQKVGSDGRLRTDFKQNGAVSMRFSSTRINLQALPHDYKLEAIDGVPTPRSLFRPREGYELWEFDYAQAELRVATAWAECKEMRRLLEAGEDAHGWTAERIFGELTPERRQIAKRANFSFIFEIGPQRFKDDLEKQGHLVTLAQSKEIIDTWRALFPEYGRANRAGENQARKFGYVTLVSGRQRWFRQGEDYHKAFNQRVQGSIAETVKDWMLLIEERYPGVLVLQVHDSVWCEVPVEEAARMTADIRRLGEELATERFGIAMIVDAKPKAA